MIEETGEEWATFAKLQREQNVAKPTVRYRDLADRPSKLDESVVLKAEAIPPITAHV